MFNININKATFHDTAGNIELLKNIHVVLEYGDILWIKGANGCGKTTLLKILAGVIPILEPCDYEGEILLDGHPLSADLMAQSVSFCFQSAEYQFLFDNVRRQFFISELQNDKLAFVKSALMSANKGDILEKSVKDISSGERKLIALLATLQKNRMLQLFDEPTANLDNNTIRSALGLIQNSSKERVTVIASHDPLISKVCNKILFFDETKQGWRLTYQSTQQESIQFTDQVKPSTSIRTDTKETESVFVCREISYKYPDGTRAFKNISCRIGRGEIVGLIGKNGSGKTTFIKIISRGIKPNEGEILLNTTSRPGIVFQENEKQLFGFTVWEEILLGLKRSVEQKQEAEKLLRQLNLFSFKDHSPFFLSGGQKQLLLIGSILIHHPEFIIFDEPFSGLDRKSMEKAANLICEYHKLYHPTIIISDQDNQNIKDLVDNYIIFS